MRIDILTLFPDMVSGALDHSIVGRAIRSGVVDIRVHDLRHWTTDRHRTADDVPFGGGAGMVLKAEPLMQAISDICDGSLTERAERILLCPQGDVLSQATIARLAALPRILLVCGHYEGIDDRVRTSRITSTSPSRTTRSISPEGTLTFLATTDQSRESANSAATVSPTNPVRWRGVSREGIAG